MSSQKTEVMLLNMSISTVLSDGTCLNHMSEQRYIALPKKVHLRDKACEQLTQCSHNHSDENCLVTSNSLMTGIPCNHTSTNHQLITRLYLNRKSVTFSVYMPLAWSSVIMFPTLFYQFRTPIGALCFLPYSISSKLL